mgnify:CR=1 FL=1
MLNFDPNNCAVTWWQTGAQGWGCLSILCLALLCCRSGLRSDALIFSDAQTTPRCGQVLCVVWLFRNKTVDNRPGLSIFSRGWAHLSLCMLVLYVVVIVVVVVKYPSHLIVAVWFMLIVRHIMILGEILLHWMITLMSMRGVCRSLDRMWVPLSRIRLTTASETNDSPFYDPITLQLQQFSPRCQQAQHQRADLQIIIGVLLLNTYTKLNGLSEKYAFIASSHHWGWDAFSARMHLILA